MSGCTWPRRPGSAQARGPPWCTRWSFRPLTGWCPCQTPRLVVVCDRAPEPGGPVLLGADWVGIRGEQLVSRDRRLAEAAQEPVERVRCAHPDRVCIGEVDD